MKNVLVVRSSNRAIDEAAADCVLALVSDGAALIKQRGSSEVSYARNFALTSAVRALKHPTSQADVVLMVDDDMVFTPAQAFELTGAAVRIGAPCSACYLLGNGFPPFERLPSGRFVGGLGMLAIPRSCLLELAERSHVYRDREGQPMVEFTWSASDLDAAGDRRWVSEDWRLTERLGGFELLPIAIGHLKTRALFPPAATIAALLEKKES